MRRVLIIAAILLIPIVPIVLVVTGVLKKAPVTVTAVRLTVWGTEDTAANFAQLIAKYRQTRSYVTIDYVQMRSEDYYQQLLQAWAQGTGPDVFFVPSTWIGQMSQYSIPMPADLSIPQVIVTKGVLGNNAKVVVNQKAAPSLNALQDAFVDTVTGDVVRDGQTWALPLSMDTLATYYNKDLLNNAKIFEPAKTWSDLQNQIVSNHLTITDQNGRLAQSGVALGTVANLPHSTDLLTLLMMQNGAIMTSNDKQAHFQDTPGLTALKFFLSFAQTKKVNYSWDANQPNALEAFLQGKVAYYFGSLSDRAQIAASQLNWGVGPMLHIRQSGDNDALSNSERFIDAANYQVAMVSKASQLAGRDVYAWNFVEYSSEAGNVSAYLDPSGKLAAQKSVLVQQKDNPTLSVYAGQLLTARSWYHVNGGQTIEKYFQDLITGGLSEKNDLQELLNLAAQQVVSTL
ncbi:MAG: extracellular solute-binding protein [Candidatus Kerfeldbacteria bacterium]|nr:extracellular solute-binding protein [Candidatus Kerfeldbacteria bacterium]